MTTILSKELTDKLKSVDTHSLSTEKRKEVKLELNNLKQKINFILNDIEEKDIEEERKKRIENSKTYVGKCFKLKDEYMPQTHSEIIAFKILNFLPSPYEFKAKCVALIEEWKGKGIKISNYPILHYDTKKMIPPKDCIRFIDNFEECSEEEFKTMVCQFYDEVLNEVEE